MRTYKHLLTATLLLSAISWGWSQPNHIGNDPGWTITKLRQLFDSAPPGSGTVQAISLLYVQKEDSIAVVSRDGRSRWKIDVFSLPNGRAQLDWSSGKLDDSFTVSDPNALKIFSFGDEQGFEFMGCAAHVCPDVYSVLLYVPSKHAGFIGRYVWGKTTYSPNVESPANKSYKAALDELLRQHSANH